MVPVGKDIVSDASEAAQGYASNLDLEEEEEELATLQDAIQRVEAHNRRVRARMQKR
jgi:hypothetical protein